MDERFSIVFAGELQDDVQAEDVIARLVATFKLPEAKARALVLDGNRHVVKKSLDEKAVRRYRSALENAGMIVQIVSTAPPTERLGPAPREDESATERENAAAGPDPYAAPRADLRPEPRSGQLRGPGAVPAGRGWSWIVRGFWHFKTNALAWILAVVLMVGISIVLTLIPFIGTFVTSILGAVFGGGLMLGARTQDEGGDFRLEHLFAGFRDNLGQLALVGLLYLVGGVLIAVLVGGLILGSVLPLIGALDPTALEARDPTVALAAIGPIGLIAMLAGALLFIPLVMSFLFAPALVMLDQLNATDAMKLSFVGCLKNMLPFLIYGTAGLVLILLAMIPFGLGLLVVWPILTAAIYVAYRDIYFASETRPFRGSGQAQGT
jgi:hypothetical protein